jgi:hypothetical protein
MDLSLLFLLRGGQMPPLVIVLFFLLFIALFLFIAAMNRRNVNKAWDNLIQVGDQLGIRIEKPRVGFLARELPMLRGTYRNHLLKLHTEMRGSGKHRKSFTVLSITVTGRYPDLEVYKESLFSRIGKALGMQDIQTGVAEFDQGFILRCADESFAREIFDTSLCGKMVEAAGWLKSGINLRGGSVTYTEIGPLSSDQRKERFIQAIALCLELVKGLEHTQSKAGSRTGTPSAP